MRGLASWLLESNVGSNTRGPEWDEWAAPLTGDRPPHLNTLFSPLPTSAMLPPLVAVLLAGMAIPTALGCSAHNGLPGPHSVLPRRGVSKQGGVVIWSWGRCGTGGCRDARASRSSSRPGPYT